LAEKKALRRFLLVYILSTIFLIAIGEYFYYKLAYKNIIDNELNRLEKEIKEFLQKYRGKLLMIKNPKTDLKMAIYVDKKLVFKLSLIGKKMCGLRIINYTIDMR
jgi:two-component system OmpR family sensor kinase